VTAVEDEAMWRTQSRTWVPAGIRRKRAVGANIRRSAVCDAASDLSR
jgi:hypothetical protein